MPTLISNSEKDTKQIAARLAKKIKHGIVALSGELGVGKTVFVQGFAKELGIKEKIISPTFVLIRQHQIPNTSKFLFHIDLYRLDESHGLGLEEIIKSDNFVLIEWAEKIKKILPEKTKWIKIEKRMGKRLISLS